MCPQRILIVEDNDVIALALACMVQKTGHQVMGKVRTGEEAVRRTLTEPVDLLIMDIQLAGTISGIEAVARIRAHRPMPVIYASANTDLLEQEQCPNSPCTAFLAKPIALEQLEAAIDQLTTECDQLRPG